MPCQVPSADFIAKGGASLVATTNSPCDETPAFCGVCARHGSAKIHRVPINNAPIISNTRIVTRPGTSKNCNLALNLDHTVRSIGADYARRGLSQSGSVNDGYNRSPS